MMFGTDDERDEDFEALFAEFSDSMEAAPTRVGERVKGTVITIGNEYAFVSLGGKAEGMIPREEILDDEEEPMFKPGDEVEATVVSRAGRDGGIRLSVRALKSSLDDELLREAFESRLPVEGKVLSHNKGGFVIQIGGKEAFCPISQIELGFTHDAEAHIGQSYPFRITELGAGRFVVSRAQLLREERESRMEVLKGSLKAGDILEGTVDSLRDFGAFVDIGGVQGLVHISQVSWSRVKHPSEALEVGQAVRVKVVEVDWDRERIGLSIREAEGDPWDSIAWKVGDRLPATVTRLADFGAFMELTNGLEGLLHVSEMSWERRVRKPSDMFTVGDTAEVVILGINPLERRISLGLKQMESDPWVTVAKRLKVGQKVKGTVEKVADFGVFVSLGEGLNGLVPNREMDTDRNANHRKDFPDGCEIEVVVQEIDTERRRISLSRKAVREMADREVPSGVLGDQSGGAGMGTFGELLKGKLDGLDLKK